MFRVSMTAFLPAAQSPKLGNKLGHPFKKSISASEVTDAAGPRHLTEPVGFRGNVQYKHLGTTVSRTTITTLNPQAST